MNRKLLRILCLVLSLAVGCTSPPAGSGEETRAVPTAIASASPAPAISTDAPVLEVTQAASAASPTTYGPPGFVVGEASFRFVGGFVPGWHWADELWSEAVDDDLLATARENGITTIHLMLPQFEKQLGIYEEAEAAKLDHFLDSAARYGVYVMPSFIHGFAIAVQPEDPYYDPAGIEGLMRDERLFQAFRNRISYLVNRRNSVNGRLYRDDPTIMAWILVDEPVSASFNYPGRPPDVTSVQLSEWMEDTAVFVKGLDPNHMVTANTKPMSDVETDVNWILGLDAPSLDFIYAEDADMLILTYFPGHTPDVYPLALFSIGKPVVMTISFTSGLWDDTTVCQHEDQQADLVARALKRYDELGSPGVVVQRWGTDLYGSPVTGECGLYTASDTLVAQVLRDFGLELNLPGRPRPPLEFVTVRPQEPS